MIFGQDFIARQKNNLLCVALITLSNSGAAGAQNSPSVINNLPAILTEYKAGHYERAADLCAIFLKANPGSLNAHYLMGNILVQRNQIDDAETHYKFCLTAGKNVQVAIYAQKALTQIALQRAATNKTGAVALAAVAAGSNTKSVVRSTDDYIQEQTNQILKDTEAKVEVRRRMLNDRIALTEEEMHQEEPRYHGRGLSGELYHEEVMEGLSKETKTRIDKLRKAFELEEEQLRKDCQTRIDNCTAFRRNLEAQSLKTKRSAGLQM